MDIYTYCNRQLVRLNYFFESKNINRNILKANKIHLQNNIKWTVSFKPHNISVVENIPSKYTERKSTITKKSCKTISFMVKVIDP